MSVSLFLLATFVSPAGSFAEGKPAPNNREAAPVSGGPNVLILGDSLALCGFGKRLDERFRKSGRVHATFTYLACATTPLHWLKGGPYGNIKTHCGFWSIESGPGSNQVRELEDVYGMRRGSTPKPHPVPKLEDLLATVHPDILVMQTGTNLFDLFPDHKTVRLDRDRAALRNYIAPFVNRAVRTPSPLRKIYWVASPTSGRVSKEIQDFVFEQTRADLGNAGLAIDSRTLVSYPYHHMEPDKEHFIGSDMDEWADKVFGIIEKDLASQPLASTKPLSEVAQGPAPEQVNPPAERAQDAGVFVSAKLVSKTEPIPIKEMLPYQEFLVGYVYDVTKVLAGQYSENKILVMHPAYIALKKQRQLRRYKVGRTYKLRLHELDGTVWKTVKSKDDTDSINLQPYILVDDESKFPGNAR